MHGTYIKIILTVLKYIFISLLRHKIYTITLWEFCEHTSYKMKLANILSV